MKVAIVTPYCREPVEILRQCHLSVVQQSHEATHFMVADGVPEPAVTSWPVRHIVLPAPHRDTGNAARHAGCRAAIEAGYDAIALLDADNWFQPDHVRTMVALCREHGAGVASAGRSLHRADGSFLGHDTVDSTGDGFADTSCMFFARPALPVLDVWGRIPVALAGVGDRIVWLAVLDRVARRVHSPVASVCYRTLYAAHYLRAGETPPPGLPDKMTGIRYSRDLWNLMPAALRRRIVFAGDPAAEAPPPWPEDRPDAPPAYRRNFTAPGQPAQWLHYAGLK